MYMEPGMKKFFIITLLAFLSINNSYACSEAGPLELKLSPEAEKSCSKDAKIYAEQFAKTIISVRRNKTSIQGPSGKVIKANAPKLYTTKKRSSSGQAGYNVTVSFDKQNECTICVEMAVLDGYCNIETVEKFMCNF